jgi:hypothetical protein
VCSGRAGDTLGDPALPYASGWAGVRALSLDRSVLFVPCFRIDLAGPIDDRAHCVGTPAHDEADFRVFAAYPADCAFADPY